jgi:hypothetical protein
MGLDIEGQHRGVGDVRPDARRQLVAGAPKGLVACVIRRCPENAKTGRQGRAMREN